MSLAGEWGGAQRSASLTSPYSGGSRVFLPLAGELGTFGDVPALTSAQQPLPLGACLPAF